MSNAQAHFLHIKSWNSAPIVVFVSFLDWCLSVSQSPKFVPSMLKWLFAVWILLPTIDWLERLFWDIWKKWEYNNRLTNKVNRLAQGFLWHLNKSNWPNKVFYPAHRCSSLLLCNAFKIEITLSSPSNFGNRDENGVWSTRKGKKKITLLPQMSFWLLLTMERIEPDLG